MLRKFWKALKNFSKERGYTLVEVAAVIVVTGSLTAVVLPVAMDKMNEGKEIAALQDCKQIGTAITAFYKDTGQFPAYSASTPSYYEVLRSGDSNTYDPRDGKDNGGTTVKANWEKTKIDYLENHLIVDNPGGTLGGTPNVKYLVTYKLNWKGPYAETFTKRDPWGNNYLVYIGGMCIATTGTDKTYGWIISAGPDGQLDTDIKDNTLQDDDIGYYPYAAEIGH
jgi:type II secretory pathway pseudopilin PulG